MMNRQMEGAAMINKWLTIFQRKAIMSTDFVQLFVEISHFTFSLWGCDLPEPQFDLSLI